MMGKLIAVWGTPDSGKTAFTMKLAGSLYRAGRRRQTRIVVVLTDVTSPSMPVVFPFYHSEEIYSLGSLMAKTTLTPDDIFSYTTLIKGRDNLGVIGYRENENSHSYPEYNREKALAFLRILADNTDYAIIDCMTNPDDSILSDVALTGADDSIRLITPDLKCLSYTMSQNPHFTARGYITPKQIAVLNTPVQGFAMPHGQLGKVDFILPYSPALAQQFTEGRLSEELSDRKYMTVVDRIAERIR